MILVYNCITAPEAAVRYEKSLKRKIETGKEIIFTGPGKAYKDIENREFSHLIISGSAASAMEYNIWDKELSRVIDDFFQTDRAILGICYGHQFLASWFLGKSCLIKMKKPEYCWSRVTLYRNPLFKGVSSDILCQIHNDSVSILPKECILIAESTTGIQGFQYEGKRVFGIQFHPDYNYEEAKAVFERVSLSNSSVRETWYKTAPGENTDRDGATILSNFVNM